MHPAFSVIFFTTASGAGYGLLALLGLGMAIDVLPDDRVFVLTAGVIALALSTAGLLASTLHLGHPERAWRAFSQWRTSWLSREGVLAVLTYLPAVLFLAGWWFAAAVPAGITTLMGILAAGCALATVYTTSMIYASLRSIHAWSNPWVPPVYLLLALGSGAIVLNGIAAWFGAGSATLSLLAIGLLALGLAAKLAYWRAIRSDAGPSSVATAIGIKPGSSVKLTQPPHTESNYLQQEMCFHIARKHAVKLHAIAMIMGFIVPGLLLLGALPGHTAVSLITCTLAVPLAAAGLLVERWLFFAEAKHTVSLYYA